MFIKINNNTYNYDKFNKISIEIYVAEIVI